MSTGKVASRQSMVHLRNCTDNILTIDNAVSPNGDQKNDFLFLQYINVIEETKNNHVTILNRWGSVVWEGDNYNNNSIMFDGKSKSGNELPSGNYFYKIEFDSGRKNKTYGEIELLATSALIMQHAV